MDDSSLIFLVLRRYRPTMEAWMPHYETLLMRLDQGLKIPYPEHGICKNIEALQSTVGPVTQQVSSSTELNCSMALIWPLTFKSEKGQLCVSYPIAGPEEPSTYHAKWVVNGVRRRAFIEFTLDMMYRRDASCVV